MLRFRPVRAAIAPLLLLPFALAGSEASGAGAKCPDQMARIADRFCIDRYEASLVLLDERGRELEIHSAFEVVADGALVRAVSLRGVHPQAHVSRALAERACRAAGKRLCQRDEWLAACKGLQPTRYPYGSKHRPGYCNDEGVSPLGILHGGRLDHFGYRALNDRRLNQVPGSLARTGSYDLCQNEWGVHDMVGNLHEWTAEADATFRGGYYLDTSTLGEGCDYAVDGHDRHYRDYSIGFRCCADG
jgi:formylglycine-generating enzyme